MRTGVLDDYPDWYRIEIRTLDGRLLYARETIPVSTFLNEEAAKEFHPEVLGLPADYERPRRYWKKVLSC